MVTCITERNLSLALALSFAHSLSAMTVMERFFNHRMTQSVQTLCNSDPADNWQRKADFSGTRSNIKMMKHSEEFSVEGDLE